MDVALFVPCYIDQLYPAVGLATVELLERCGAQVTFPRAQTCCGQPLFNMGANDEARPLAEKFLKVFEGHATIVSPSASCTAMVRHHYRTLLGDAAEPLCGRVFELCEFLHDVLHVRLQGRFARRVGLHQGCHGQRELRLASGTERRGAAFDKVRALLLGIEGLELVSLERPDECCGFGGTFAVAEEAVSCRMGRDRIADHAHGGAEIVTSTDMSCLMHLQGLLRRDASPLGVCHIAELLAEATR